MQFLTDEKLYRVIGLNIKKYRKLSNLTQGALAEIVGISVSYLSKIEATGCNKGLPISILNKIANALDVDITKFFKRYKQPMSRTQNNAGGGAKTNQNGLLFEQITSLNDALINAGLIIHNNYDVYFNEKFIGYSINKARFSTIFLKDRGIDYKLINSKRWEPDEAFINETNKTVQRLMKILALKCMVLNCIGQYIDSDSGDLGIISQNGKASLYSFEEITQAICNKKITFLLEHLRKKYSLEIISRRHENQKHFEQFFTDSMKKFYQDKRK